MISSAVWAQPADFRGQPYLLLDTATGQVHAHNRLDDLWHPASLTKLMTAYVVFEAMAAGRVTPASPVRVSGAALANPPTKMGFPVGTILNIDNALKMIMVKSANDIASALAEAVSGREKSFVASMNRHAAALGMTRTHFTNPHGLHDPAQITTARDMAILALAIASKYPQHEGYFSIPAIRFGKRRLRNHNALLERFPGANGMKTGYICASGSNIIATAQRDGDAFMAVVLGGRTGRARNVLTARLLHAGMNDRLAGLERPGLAQLPLDADATGTADDLTSQICGRRRAAKAKTAPMGAKPPSLEELEDLYLQPRQRVGQDVRVHLGKATGPNPFNFRMVDGRTPPPLVPLPIWRPDRTREPVEG